MPESVSSAQPQAKGDQTSNPTGDALGLIVFVHGLHPFFSKNSYYEGIKNLLTQQLPNHDLHSFDYLGTYWSSAAPETLALRLEQEIRQKVAEKNYKQLYLVGHSFGGLLIRQAILYGARLADDENSWLAKVKRVILLAGTNRGFQPYNRASEILATIGVFIQWLPFLHPFLRLGRLAVYGLRGSVWVTQLRMQWITMSVEKPGVLPFTVQIRGAQDKLVGPNDSHDVSVAANSLELVVKEVGHRDMALLNSARSAAVHNLLKEKIAEALSATPLKNISQSQPDHVIFLIHGIRDFAEWHEDLGMTITRVAQTAGTRVEIVPISYGYFSALQFLFPIARRRCARSFLDRYVQHFAHYPKARFSALAHSNGTYALTWALQNNRYMKLENVLLAGTVLARKFPWEKIQGQVTRVRNDCANADLPVGALCWLLSWFPPYWGDLGTAGVSGFDGPVVLGSKEAAKTVVYNNKSRSGGHGAALESKYHDEISRFLLNGAPWGATDINDRRRSVLQIISRAVILVIAVAYVFSFYLIAASGWAPEFMVLSTIAATLFMICLLLLI